MFTLASENPTADASVQGDHRARHSHAGLLDHFLAVFGVGLLANPGHDLHARAVAAQQRPFVAVAFVALALAFDLAAAAVPQGLALLAVHGFAVVEVRIALVFGPGDLHPGAGETAVKLALIVAAHLAVGAHLRGRVRHIAVVDAEGADHDPLFPPAAGFVGNADGPADPRALDVQAVDGGGIGLFDSHIGRAAAADEDAAAGAGVQARTGRCCGAGIGIGVGVDVHIDVQVSTSAAARRR